MIARPTLFIFSLLCLFFLPWWAAAVCALAGLILFDFVEILFVGFLLDMLYGAGGSFLTKILFLLIAFFLYIISTLVKKFFGITL